MVLTLTLHTSRKLVISDIHAVATSQFYVSSYRLLEKHIVKGEINLFAKTALV